MGIGDVWRLPVHRLFGRASEPRCSRQLCQVNFITPITFVSIFANFPPFEDNFSAGYVLPFLFYFVFYFFFYQINYE